jgi:hypothetical protein
MCACSCKSTAVTTLFSSQVIITNIMNFNVHTPSAPPYSQMRASPMEHMEYVTVPPQSGRRPPLPPRALATVPTVGGVHAEAREALTGLGPGGCEDGGTPTI